MDFEIPVVGNAHLQQLLSQDKAIACSDVFAEPLLESAQKICDHFEIKSMLGVRTSYKGEVNGVIGLHQCDRQRQWTLEEIELLEFIAAQLGVALAQAKLLEQEKQARVKLEKEIRDRLHAEAALKESESKYRHLVETSQDTIWSVDIEGRITFINSAVKQIYGYEPEEMIGRFWADFIPPEKVTQEIEVFQRILNGESVFQLETTCIAKNGSPVYMMLNAIALQNEDGLVIGATGTSSNITERKRAQQALQASTIKLRNHNLVLTRLAKNQVLYQGNFKAALSKITEAGAKNIEVNRVSVWLYNETRTKIRCIDLFEQNSNQHSEGFEFLIASYPDYFQAIDADQTVIAHYPFNEAHTPSLVEPYLAEFGITSMLNTPIKLGGVTVGVLFLETVGEIHDWTPEDQNFARSLSNLVSLALEARERRRAEAARRASEEKLASAFRASPDPIALSTFPEKCYIEVNDSFCSFFGYERSQVIGRTHKELGIWADIEQYAPLVEILHQTKAIRNQEVDFRIKTGEIKTTLFSAELIEIDGQQYILGTSKDITSRKQAEQESRLLLLTTQAISRAFDVDNALALILRLICNTIEWDLAEAWIPRDDGAVLEYNLGWYGNQSDLAEFCHQSQSITFTSGVGLPGRICQQQQPEWIEDVSAIVEPTFLRSQLAAEVGLKAGFGVPIKTGKQVLAVLVFFKRSAIPEDKRLLELVGAVAAQLGALIGRKLIETAHRHSEETFATSFRR